MQSHTGCAHFFLSAILVSILERLNPYEGMLELAARVVKLAFRLRWLRTSTHDDSPTGTTKIDDHRLSELYGMFLTIDIDQKIHGSR